MLRKRLEDLNSVSQGAPGVKKKLMIFHFRKRLEA